MSPRTASRARGLVSTLTLAGFVNHLNVIAWIPFLPFIAEAHGVSVSLLGQIPALMLLLSTFLGLVIGPLADRYGNRRTLFLCLLAVVASGLSTALAPTLSVLFLAALFGAIGRAAVMPVAQATAATFFAEDTARRRAISRIQGGGPLAATLGIPLLTTIAIALHWRGAFIVLSGLALGTALILQRILNPDETASSGEVRLKSILASYHPLFRHRTILTLIVAACVENIGVNAMWTYYGAFYVQHYGFSTTQVGWVSLAAGLGVLAGQTVAGGWFGGRPRLLFIAGCAGSGSLIGLSLILPLSAVAAITLMAAGWLMHGMVMVSTVVLLVGRSPAGRAMTLTLNGSAMSLGMALGAGLGGLVLAGAGYLALGVCTLALPLASVALVSIGRLGSESTSECRKSR
jgi:MFS transporter, DHA1 family, inner membrane transport protein